jgi:hypothetical protein
MLYWVIARDVARRATVGGGLFVWRVGWESSGGLCFGMSTAVC